MVDIGLFEDEKLELLRGTLVTMSPQGTKHATALRRLARFLMAAVGSRAVVQVQSPLALSDESEPEPDLSIVPNGDYWEKHPSQASLAVEVADSSLNKDRKIKTDIYAQAQIPEYWIVNLADETFEVYCGIGNGTYSEKRTYHRGDEFTLSVFPDVHITVSDFLP